MDLPSRHHLWITSVPAVVRELLGGVLGGVEGRQAMEQLERRLLAEQLEQELERSKRGARPLSVVVGALVDPTTDAEGGGKGESDGNGYEEKDHRSELDGHVAEAILGGATEEAACAGLAGNGAESAFEVLAEVVAREKRRIDTAARLGVARFAVVLPDTPAQGALALAERLRVKIGDALDDRGDRTRVSFGIATFPRHGRSSASLLSAAERALRSAIGLGGDRSMLESLEAPNTLVSVSRGEANGDGRLEAVLAMTETVDIRDNGTPGHSQTVGRYAELTAREIGLPVRISDRVRLAGVLHDVGKVTVPERVLQKPGPLDEDEWGLVRAHPDIGARLLEGLGLDDVQEWVLAHQERPDGKGYPRGLKGDEIPLEARIVAVADAYEAMTSDRPYRRALSHPAAQAELLECTATQFDGRVVDAFLRFLTREGLRVRSRPVPA